MFKMFKVSKSSYREYSKYDKIITPVNVLKKTNCFVWIDNGSENGEQTSIENNWNKYFETFEAAKNYIVELKVKEIFELNKQIELKILQLETIRSKLQIETLQFERLGD